MRYSHLKFIMAIGLIIFYGATVAQTDRGMLNVYTVGTDLNCDYTTIQDAINAVTDASTNSFQIRVTKQQTWNENLTIINKDNLRVIANFANCTDASNNVFSFGPPAELQGNGVTASGIFINNSQNLSLQGFKVSGFNLGGVTILGGSTVSMNSMEISNNNRNNTAGGGIYSGNNSNVRITFSNISANQANNGAGIYCSSGIINVDTSDVSFNQTNISSGMGGGILLDDGCIGRVYAFNTSFSPTRIHGNSAHQYGGGIAVEDGARLEVNTVQVENAIGQVFINDNTINNPVTSTLDSAGAGIYANGNGSEVLLHATVLSNNSFSDALQFVGGGAIALNNQASLIMQNRGPHQVCLDSDFEDGNCNKIRGHYVNNGDAAVIKIQGGSEASIYQTSIFDNQTGTASNQLASIIDGALVMQGNLIYDNGTRPNGLLQQPTRLIRISTNGTFYGDFLTFSNNRLWGGWVLQSFNSSSVNLTRSIVAEDNDEEVFLDSTSQPSQTLFDCILTHENNSISGTDIVVGASQFQSTWPYHISEDSPAVDMCDNNIGDLLPQSDIDGNERGPCPGICLQDRFDAGADEYTQPDVIFENGFELILM